MILSVFKVKKVQNGTIQDSKNKGKKKDFEFKIIKKAFLDEFILFYTFFDRKIGEKNALFYTFLIPFLRVFSIERQLKSR